MPKKNNQSKKEGYDIIVGIPSLNEADNISFVTQQVDEGLTKYFPNYKSLIVNVDNHSPDNTKRAFLKTFTKNDKKYITTSPGIRGKGNNFFNLFNEVKKQNAKAILVVDADLKSITPDWVEKMIKPVLKGYDYVLPLYTRNEYDGTITNLICYPILFGLIGYNIRQPIAGDFSFSSKINNYWLEQKWYSTTRQFGIDIFMTLHAVFGNFKLGQVCLGSKVHKPSAPKLNIMFTEVVSTLFKTILHQKDKWNKVSKQQLVPILNNGAVMHPQGMSIDYKSIKSTALLGYKKNRKLIRKYLSPGLFKTVDKYAMTGRMKINKQMWQRIVFDILIAYDQTKYSKDVIKAFKNLYFLRIASYIGYTLDLDYRHSERAIIDLAKLFKKNKVKLIKKL